VPNALSFILTSGEAAPGEEPGENEAPYPLNVTWSIAFPPKEID
jgi:hypothetical protein